MKLQDLLSTREEPRFRTERLRQVVGSLPPTIIINPLATIILFIPFVFWGNAFGHIPLSHLAIAAGMHVTLSTLAWFLWRRDKPGIANEDRTETQLLILQFVLSVT